MYWRVVAWGAPDEFALGVIISPIAVHIHGMPGMGGDLS